MSTDREWIESVALLFSEEDFNQIPNIRLRSLLMEKHLELSSKPEIVCVNHDEVWNFGDSRPSSFLQRERVFCFVAPQNKKSHGVVRATINIYPNGVIERTTSGMVPDSRMPRRNEIVQSIRYNASRFGNRNMPLDEPGFLNGVSFCGNCGKVSPAGSVVCSEIAELTGPGDRIMVSDETVKNILSSIKRFSCDEVPCENGSCLVPLKPFMPQKAAEPLRKRKATEQKVYVISDGKMVKVGVSVDPEKRLRGLQTGNPAPLRLDHVADVKRARLVESSVHYALGKFRTEGEWFKVKPSDAINAINHALSEI